MPRLLLLWMVAALAWGQTQNVAGRWKRVAGGQTFRLELLADATGTINGLPLRWTIRNGNQLTLLPGDGSVRTATVEATAKTLTLITPGQRLEFERDVEPAAAAPAARPAKPAAACTTVVGTWRGPDGLITLGEDGSTTIGGVKYRYTADASAITLTGADGVFRVPYRLSGGTLTVALNGQPTTLVCASQKDGGGAFNPLELAGKWCRLTNFNATSGGGRMSSACFTLKPDGTYQYSAETSNSNPYGSSVTSENDYGTWTATATTITSHSRARGATTTYTLEKRNHPKNHDPMLVLDGQAYVTYGPRAPW